MRRSFILFVCSLSLYKTILFFLPADRDFEPPCEEEDDEETIEVEEQQEGNDAESHRREIELLKEEGMLPLDQLLSTLKLPQVASRTLMSTDVSHRCHKFLLRHF